MVVRSFHKDKVFWMSRPLESHKDAVNLGRLVVTNGPEPYKEMSNMIRSDGSSDIIGNLLMVFGGMAMSNGTLTQGSRFGSRKSRAL